VARHDTTLAHAMKRHQRAALKNSARSTSITVRIRRRLRSCPASSLLRTRFSLRKQPLHLLVLGRARPDESSAPL
jgi:hypothetical protein